MELFINKISHYLPDSVVPNSYFKEVNGLDDEWIYSRTGIKTAVKQLQMKHQYDGDKSSGSCHYRFALSHGGNRFNHRSNLFPLRYRCYPGPYGATPLSHRARQMCECFLSLFFFLSMRWKLHNAILLWGKRPKP